MTKGVTKLPWCSEPATVDIAAHWFDNITTSYPVSVKLLFCQKIFILEHKFLWTTCQQLTDNFYGNYFSSFKSVAGQYFPLPTDFSCAVPLLVKCSIVKKKLHKIKFILCHITNKPLAHKTKTTYIVRFLLHNWQVFLFDLSRPISTVIFCCTGTISISGKWNYLKSQCTQIYRNHQSHQLVDW